MNGSAGGPQPKHYVSHSAAATEKNEINAGTRFDWKVVLREKEKDRVAEEVLPAATRGSVGCGLLGRR